MAPRTQGFAWIGSNSSFSAQFSTVSADEPVALRKQQSPVSDASEFAVNNQKTIVFSDSLLIILARHYMAYSHHFG